MIHTLDYDRRLASTSDALSRQFGDRAAVSPGESLSVLGSTSTADPERAALQRKRRHQFPFPLTRIGRRQLVLVCDIAAVLVGPPPSLPPTPPPSPAEKRGPGRPRKHAAVDTAVVAGGAP